MQRLAVHPGDEGHLLPGALLGREQLEQQLADIQRYSFDPQSIEMLRQRLEADRDAR